MTTEPIYLSGCGVICVCWIPVDGYSLPIIQMVPSVCKYATPLLAINDARTRLRKNTPANGTGPRTSGCLIRVAKSLLRNRIETWDALCAVTSKEFCNWKNYGLTSHRELVSIAKENGYSVAKYG